MRVLSVSRLGQLPWLLAVVVTSVLLPSAAEASFKRTPDSGSSKDSRWGLPVAPWSALDSSSAASQTESAWKWSLLYAARNKHSASEQGRFSDNYSTAFYDSWYWGLKNGFVLKWDGGDSIDTSSPTYLVLKVGKKQAKQFVFDISADSKLGWDGKSQIFGYKFWKGVRHVAIYGGKKCPPVIPEPTSWTLMSLGVVCMAGYRSRRRRG